MPFLDLQSRLGLNLDQWLLVQSAEQPYKKAARCHAFEKEWLECGHGIGRTRAEKECKLEYEDFFECMHRQKLGVKGKLLMFVEGPRAVPKRPFKRLEEIQKQKKKLIKEGSYTSPAHHGQ